MQETSSCNKAKNKSILGQLQQCYALSLVCAAPSRNNAYRAHSSMQLPRRPAHQLLPAASTLKHTTMRSVLGFRRPLVSTAAQGVGIALLNMSCSYYVIDTYGSARPIKPKPLSKAWQVSRATCRHHDLHQWRQTTGSSSSSSIQTNMLWQRTCVPLTSGTRTRYKAIGKALYL